MSERWNIPPWEVRQNATEMDRVRLRMIDNIRSQGDRAKSYIQEQKAKLERRYSNTRR